MQHDKKIALFIDCENISADAIDFVLDELSNHGATYIKNAYGNWNGTRLKKWHDKLQLHGIKPIQQFDYTKQKNAADIAMVIDIMDLLYDKTVDAIALATSDCDFTPAVMRILRNGLPVYGFGERKTPDAFVNACTSFIYTDKTDQKTDTKPIIKQPDKYLINLLKKAIGETQDVDGWANAAEVGIYISRRSSVSIKNYGHQKLGDVFSDLSQHFETRYDDDIRKKVLYVKSLSY